MRPVVKNKPRIDPRKLTSVFGLCATAIIAISSLITALAYRGESGEPYSILNHYISELGQVGVSPLALLFNVCLIAAGLFMVVFMLGLGQYFGTKLSCVAAVVGVFCAFSCSLVGVFPMNNLSTHVPVAFSFFYSGLVTITLFTVVTIVDKQKTLPKWLAVFGVMGASSFAGFLAVPHLTHMTHTQTLSAHIVERPAFSLITTLEWAIFFTLMLWILLVSLELMLGQHTEPAG